MDESGKRAYVRALSWISSAKPLTMRAILRVLFCKSMKTFGRNGWKKRVPLIFKQENLHKHRFLVDNTVTFLKN